MSAQNKNKIKTQQSNGIFTGRFAQQQGFPVDMHRNTCTDFTSISGAHVNHSILLCVGQVTFKSNILITDYFAKLFYHI
jgi:hypothetical protein